MKMVDIEESYPGLKIERVRGYWEVTINGKFFCSADTYTEAVNEFRTVYSRYLKGE